MAHELRALGATARPGLDGIDRAGLARTRTDLAACFRMAARYGLEEGICNHFSAVVPGRDDLFVVNPYGLAFAEIRASDLLVCSLDGHVLEGEGRRRRPQPSSSTPGCTPACRGRAPPSTPTCRTPPRSAWSRVSPWPSPARPR